MNNYLIKTMKKKVKIVCVKNEPLMRIKNKF